MADPDLQMGGGGEGGRSFRPWDKRAGPVSKKIFVGPSGLILVEK